VNEDNKVKILTFKKSGPNTKIKIREDLMPPEFPSIWMGTKQKCKEHNTRTLQGRDQRWIQNRPRTVQKPCRIYMPIDERQFALQR
jgi:hypothetical protein